jgi:hypothetical protein
VNLWAALNSGDGLIVLGHSQCRDWTIRRTTDKWQFVSRHGQGTFSKQPRPILTPIRPPTEWVARGLCPGGGRGGNKSNET